MKESVIHKYGDHVDTDTILPGAYLTLRTADELAPHCFEGLDPEFIKRVQPGDIVVGGKNFGCGSSREHAPVAIKGAGIACVVAESFARIFYRNAINIGLPVFECPELVAAAKMGQTIQADVQKGEFVLDGVTYQARPLTPYLQDILKAGGLVPFVRQQRNGDALAATQTT